MNAEIQELKKNNMDKKSFSEWVKDREHDGLYWSLFSSSKEDNPIDIGLKYIIKVLNAKKGFDKLKPLAGLNFKDYIDTAAQASKSKYSDWH